MSRRRRRRHGCAGRGKPHPQRRRPTPLTAGSFTGTGAINFNLGVFGTQHNHANAQRAGLYRRRPDVANGTVTLSPTSPTTWGSPTRPTMSPRSIRAAARLTVGANATLAADNLVLAGNLYTSRDTTTGGTGVLNVNAATSKVTANTLNFGMSLLPFDTISQNPPPGVLPPTFSCSQSQRDGEPLQRDDRTGRNQFCQRIYFILLPTVRLRGPLRLPRR